VEVEDGLFEKGRKVQQHRAYESSGVVDGKNQEWLILPAGKRRNEPVFYIINYGFLKYLDASHLQGEAQVLDGNDSESQLWTLEIIKGGAGNALWKIRSLSTRSYLTYFAGYTTDGEPLHYGVSKGTNTVFTFQIASNLSPTASMPSGYANIVSKLNAQRHISIANGSTNNGAVINVYNPVFRAPFQTWQLVQTRDGFFKIQSGLTGKCIDVTGWEGGNNSTLVSWDCADVEKQKWQVIPVAREPGYVIFFNKVSGKCMDIAGGDPNSYADVSTYLFRNKDNQKWKLIPWNVRRD
jgi:hypothetical protein